MEFYMEYKASWSDLSEEHWERQMEKKQQEESPKKKKTTKKVTFALNSKIHRYEWIPPVNGFQTPDELTEAVENCY